MAKWLMPRLLYWQDGYTYKAKPVVSDVVSFSEELSSDEPNALQHVWRNISSFHGKSSCQCSQRETSLVHEMHSKVEYIVAHGISTTIEGKKAVIGSWHFVMEDEKCVIPEGMEDRFEHLPLECSHLYLAIEGKLAAVICRGSASWRGCRCSTWIKEMALQKS